jgi:hypothetical protein
MGKPITLANCSLNEFPKVMRRGLHPTRERSALIFAAGALNNCKLLKDLGSQERSTFYDGMVAAGHLEENPYWPRHSKNGTD